MKSISQKRSRVNKIIASNARENLPKLGSSPCENKSLNNSPIIAGGCSGFEHNTDLVTQASLGLVTAALQMQRGGINVPDNNDISTSSYCDRSTLILS